MLGYQGTEKLGDSQQMSSNWLPQSNSWRPSMDGTVGMPLSQAHGLEHNTVPPIATQPFAFAGVIYPPYAGTSQMGNMLPTSNGLSQSSTGYLQGSGYGGGSYGGAYSLGYGLPSDIKQERKTPENQAFLSPVKSYTDLSQNQRHTSDLDKTVKGNSNNCGLYTFQKIPMAGSDKTDSDSDQSTPSTFNGITLKENAGSPFSDLSRDDTPNSGELNWVPCEDWKPHGAPLTHQQQAPIHTVYDSRNIQGGFQTSDFGIDEQMNQHSRKAAKPKATKIIGGMEIPKRDRLSYTRYQLELMVGIYKEVDYPNKVQKHLIAKRVGISKDQVKIWFQNRRRRELIAKQHPDSADARRKQAKDEEEELRRLNPVVAQDIIDCVVKELRVHEESSTSKQKAKRKQPPKPASNMEVNNEGAHNNGVSDYIPNGQNFLNSSDNFSYNQTMQNGNLDSDKMNNRTFEINTTVANPPNQVSLNRTPIKTPPTNDTVVQRKRPADEQSGSVTSSIPHTPSEAYTVFVPNAKKQKQNEEDYEKSQKDNTTCKAKPGFCPPNMIAPRGGELNKALLGLIESSVTSTPSTFTSTAPSRTTSVSSDCSVGSSPRKPRMSSGDHNLTGQSPDPKAYLGNARHHPRNVKTEIESPVTPPLNYSTVDPSDVAQKQLHFDVLESDGCAKRQTSPVAETYNNPLSIDVPEIKPKMADYKQINGNLNKPAQATANGYDSGLLMVSPLARAKSISPPFVSQSSFQPGVLPYMGYTSPAPWLPPATTIQPQMTYNTREQHIVQ